MLVHMLHQGSQFHTVFIYNHEVNSMLNIYDSVPYLPVSIQIQDKCSALLLASKKGHLEVVKCLLDKGVEINDKDEVRYISSIYMYRSLLLINIWIMYVTIACICDHHLRVLCMQLSTSV